MHLLQRTRYDVRLLASPDKAITWQGQQSNVRRRPTLLRRPVKHGRPLPSAFHLAGFLNPAPGEDGAAEVALIEGFAGNGFMDLLPLREGEAVRQQCEGKGARSGLLKMVFVNKRRSGIFFQFLISI